MIIELKHNYSEKERSELFLKLDTTNTAYNYLPKQNIIIAPKLNDSDFLKNISGIERIIEIDTPYQLASLRYKSNTSFDVKGATISNTDFQMIAGPCSIESEEQIEQTAKLLAETGVKFIRGGAYKPRTSPYSFRGLGLDGLKLIRKAADKYNLRVVTEILDFPLLDEVYQYADVLQVGSRNMQNFYLLNELGKIDKPVLLKRGMHARVSEWLLAAEYVLSGGNDKVILCERGIRSFDSTTRNVLDVGIIPLIKELSHLPIIADPSHGTGHSSRVAAMSLASVAAGANGLLIEIHPNPTKALSDGQQAITLDAFKKLNEQVNTLREYLKNMDYVLKPQSL